MDLKPVIGFEVHAQLATRSKIFCACPNESGGRPNTRVCPVCLGLPGALPSLSEEVIELGIRVALALDATVAQRTSFARKNYFYPDLPKGYQITQFGEPLAVGGHLDVGNGGRTRRVRIRQIHLEEDAGKTVHAPTGESTAGLIDMNRCGTPLVEIVTEPDIRDLAEADAFLTGLHRLLVFLGVTGGRMHLGEVRFDTNISMSEPGGARGQATEIKNLNSFRSAQRALAYEIERQTEVLRSGGTVVHETLLWDAETGRAHAMRSKEEEHDYRYFPEPDLLPVTVDRGRVAGVLASMPELPEAMRERFVRSYGVAPHDAAVLTSDPDAAAWFELTLREVLRALNPSLGIADVREALLGHRGGALPRLFDFPLPERAGGLEETARTVGRWVSVVAPGILRKEEVDEVEPASPEGDAGRTSRLVRRAGRLAQVLAPYFRGEVSETAAKKLYEVAVSTDGSVEELIAGLGLSLVSEEGPLREAVRAVLDRLEHEVRRYREGDVRLIRFFMGEVMKETGGAADPAVARSLLEDELNRR